MVSEIITNIAKVLNEKKENINEFNTKSIDSLSKIELVLVLEEITGQIIEIKELETIETISDVVNYLVVKNLL